MAELIQLIKYSGPSVILILVGLVWGKNLIEHFFSKSIEIKKLELNQNLENYKKQIDIESKNFQFQLDTKLDEFNIRFSKLHQERAEVIKELFKKITELQSAMFDLTRVIQPVIKDSKKEDEQRIERANNALLDFKNYYIPNKIWFKKEIVSKLDNLAKEYWDKGWDFAYMQKQFNEGGLPKELTLEYSKKSREISKIVENDFNELIEQLGNEFRELLGVE